MEDPADVEKAIKDSKIKYDKKGNLVDVRWQKDIESYAQWQAGNRQLNNELLEYNRMQKELGKDAPYKTLGAFRREARKPKEQQSVHMRRWKNRKTDQKEYEKLKKLLGDDAPETFDKFGEIKYNKDKQAEYAVFQRVIDDDKIRKQIGTDRYPLSIHTDRQGKHIKGHKNFIENRSYLAIDSVEEGQRFADYLVKTYSGTGRFVRNKKGGWEHKEIITAKEIISFVKDDDGNWISTRRAAIHYSKDGAHVVPA